MYIYEDLCLLSTSLQLRLILLALFYSFFLGSWYVNINFLNKVLPFDKLKHFVDSTTCLLARPKLRIRVDLHNRSADE